MNEDRPYDESPEQRRRIRDAIDACRPVPQGESVEDLNQPELEFLATQFDANPEDRERLERVQRFDRQIQDQLSDVPVPQGLADRLLAALEKGAESNDVVTGSDPLGEALADRDSATGEVRPATRRQPSTLKWLVGTAIAAAVGFIVVSMLQTPQPLLVDDVHDAALKWANQQQGVGKIPADEPEAKELRTQYPPSPLVSRAVSTKVSKLKGFLERQGAVYSLTAQDGSQAYLLVVDVGVDLQNTDVLIGRPDNEPFDTMGLSMLAWREEGLLYVLVVPDEEGHRDPVQQFLDLEGGRPIAIHQRPMRAMAWV